MTIKKYTVKSYTIESHPEPEKVYEWIRENWHNLNDHSLDEYLNSLKAFCDRFNFDLDYSFGTVPDRGQFIKISANGEKLKHNPSLKHDSDYIKNFNCDFTGCYCDELIIDVFRKTEKQSLQSRLNDIEFNILKSLHSETEYQYSEQALFEHCEANDYYFLESGEFDSN